MTTNTKKSRRKWLWLGGIVLLIVISAVIVFSRIQSSSPANGTDAGTGEKATAFIGNLSANATASGRVQAQREAQLALSQSGTVADILINVGDHVASGAILLTLETAALERAVIDARQNLAIQEANLSNLLAPASQADITAAEAAVLSAEAELNDLIAGPTEDQMAQAEADIRAANAEIGAAAADLNDARSGASEAEIQAAQLQLEIAQTGATQAAEQHSTILVTEPNRFLSETRLEDLEFSARTQALQANADLQAAQETYDQLSSGDPNAIASASAQLALANAQRDAAQANMDLLLTGATAAQIAAAQANVVQAEATLENLKRDPKEAQVVQMETAVAQAAIAIEMAENNLAEATLLAPFAGVVTDIMVNEGEIASGVLVQLTDDEHLEVVLDVDEVDIGKIAHDQAATITLESWPDVEIDGAVASISPIATEGSSAIVSYRVFLSLAESELPILIGMTANADLLTDNLENVLLVPNGAINADRNSGTFSVNKVSVDDEGNEMIEEVEVTIGLRDGRFTQITSGLEEGDELIVGTIAPRFQFGPGGGDGDSRNDGGPSFGGGG